MSHSTRRTSEKISVCIHSHLSWLRSHGKESSIYRKVQVSMPCGNVIITLLNTMERKYKSLKICSNVHTNRCGHPLVSYHKGYSLGSKLPFIISESRTLPYLAKIATLIGRDLLVQGKGSSRHVVLHSIAPILSAFIGDRIVMWGIRKNICNCEMVKEVTTTVWEFCARIMNTFRLFSWRKCAVSWSGMRMPVRCVCQSSPRFLRLNIVIAASEASQPSQLSTRDCLLMWVPFQNWHPAHPFGNRNQTEAE